MRLFSLDELEKEGFRIYKLEINRLQSKELITSLINELKNGGIIVQPIHLIDLQVVLNAGRSVINPRSDVEKRKRKIESVDDLSERELKWLNEGKLLVILDGNHRYTSLKTVLDDNSTPESIENNIRLRRDTYFTIDRRIKTKEDLNKTFLEINTQRSNISNEDIIPYILEAFGNVGGPYRYDLALYSLTTAGRDGIKTTESNDFIPFNYKTAQFLCNGCGKTSPIYNNTDRLREIAIVGKEGFCDKMIMSSNNFEDLIMIPYVFEINLSKNFKKNFKRLVYNDKNSFMKHLMDNYEKRNSIDSIHFTFGDIELIRNNFLPIFYSFVSNEIANESLLNEYLEIKGEDLCTDYKITATTKRRELMISKFSDFLRNLDAEKINKSIEDFALLKDKFYDEVINLEISEKNLLEARKEQEISKISTANYKNKHNHLFKNQKQSVLAMYNFRN